MKADQESHRISRISFAVYTALHIFNLLFILHNIYKYVIGLKMKQPLIWMFYLFLLLETVLKIIEFSLSIVYPDPNYQSRQAAVIFWINISGLVTAFFIEMILVLTMHTLALSLKLILQEINLQNMKRHKRNALIFMIIYAFIYIVSSAYLWTLTVK